MGEGRGKNRLFQIMKRHRDLDKVWLKVEANIRIAVHTVLIPVQQKLHNEYLDWKYFF